MSAPAKCEPGRVYAVRVTVEVAPCGEDGPFEWSRQADWQAFATGTEGDDFEALARQAAGAFAEHMASADRERALAAAADGRAMVARYEAKRADERAGEGGAR